MIQGTRILLDLLLAGFLRLAGLPPAEAIEHTEGNGRNGKEVHRRDGFPVISKKGKPAFCWLRVSRSSFHPAGNRSFRDIETEHEKFDEKQLGSTGRGSGV